MTGSSMALASHVVLLVISALVAARYVRAGLAGRLRAIEPHEFVPPLVWACGALAIERAYFSAAEMLRGRGIDLWSLHPAPALLSGVVAAGFFGLLYPLLAPRISDGERPYRRLGREAVPYVLLWLAIAIWGA